MCFLWSTFWISMYYLDEIRCLRVHILKAPRAGRQEIMVMSPVGVGIKNHCAGEAHQQFSGQYLKVSQNDMYCHLNFRATLFPGMGHQCTSMKTWISLDVVEWPQLMLHNFVIRVVAWVWECSIATFGENEVKHLPGSSCCVALPLPASLRLSYLQEMIGMCFILHDI
jgi:hypothetical protein